MNRKQKQELKGFLRKEIARLEDVESQSSDIPFEWISTTPVCSRYTA